MKIKDLKKIQANLIDASKVKLVFHVDDAFKDLKDEDRKQIKSIQVDIEATHAGIINGNQFFYLPKGMQDGAKSFVEPYQKPIHVQHERGSDPIGRVIASDYVSYDSVKAPGIITDSINPEDSLESILDFVQSDEFNSDEYKGLGHIHLVASISDPDAIQKILDKRYLTVSIGGSVKDVTCSRCGTNISNQIDNIRNGVEEVEVEDQCMHELGIKYSDSEKPLFYIGGLMDFEEVSYVSSPADPYTNSTVRDSKQFAMQVSDMKFEKNDGSLYAKFKAIDSTQIENNTMKIKLKDFLVDQVKALQLLKDKLTEMGLELFILTDERYNSMRKPSFLFQDQKILPIADKAHVLAAYKVLEDLEDETGESVLSNVQIILDNKAKRLFGQEFNFDDSLASLVPQTTDIENPTVDETNLADEVVDSDVTSIDYDTLAQKIVEKLSTTLADSSKLANTSIDYLLKRVDMLENEIEDMISSEKEMTESIKDYIIDHILTLTDKESIDSLKEKDLGYLKDKLAEVKADVEKVKDKVEAGIEITDSSVTPNDGGTKDNNAVVEDTTTDTKHMDFKVVRDEYTKIIRTKGLIAASKYLADLRAAKKIPEGFKITY